MFSLFSQMTWVDCLTITSQHHQSSICHSFPYSTTLPSYLVPRQHSHNLYPPPDPPEVEPPPGMGEEAPGMGGVPGMSEPPCEDMPPPDMVVIVMPPSAAHLDSNMPGLKQNLVEASSISE